MIKKLRLASKSGQLTTGGRLPRWHGALQILTLLRRECDAASTCEIKAPRHAAEITEATVPVILQEAVLEHFRAERQSNRTPGPSSASPASAASGFAAGSDLPPHNDAETAAMLVFDTRLPRSKRLMDLGILLCTAPIWLPLMALVMAVIKVASQGPAFYRQSRIGFLGKEFMIFKFRSMHVNAETRAHEEYLEQLMMADSPMTKLDASDPRLIPCGRFLRATGLDELPQLFNVLRGDMSLVGPRPCTVVEYQRYRPEHRARVNMPPGLTGLWQVNGKNRTTFSEMIAMDIFYVENRSLSLDLSIIWKTLPAILRQTRDSSAAVRAMSGRASDEAIACHAASFERLRERV